MKEFITFLKANIGQRDVQITITILLILVIVAVTTAAFFQK